MLVSANLHQTYCAALSRYFTLWFRFNTCRAYFIVHYGRYVIRTCIKTAAVTFLLICLLTNAVNARSLYLPNDVQSDGVKSTLNKGSRIRFWSRNLERDPYIAVVDQVRENELTITMKGREEVFKLTFTELERLEVSQGPGHNNTLKFALIGGLTLGTVAFIAASPQGGKTYDEDLRGLAFFTGVLVGGAAGALVGLATSSGEKWEEISLDTLRVGCFKSERGNILWAVSLKY